MHALACSRRFYFSPILQGFGVGYIRHAFPLLFVCGAVKGVCRFLALLWLLLRIMCRRKKRNKTTRSHVRWYAGVLISEQICEH
jgi:hypothetical protein